MIINDSLEPYKSLEEWMDRDGITVLVKESGQMRYRLRSQALVPCFRPSNTAKICSPENQHPEMQREGIGRSVLRIIW